MDHSFISIDRLVRFFKLIQKYQIKKILMLNLRFVMKIFTDNKRPIGIKFEELEIINFYIYYTIRI